MYLPQFCLCSICFTVRQTEDTCLMASFPGNLDKLPTERQTILDFNKARDDGMAAASAGSYANHLHLAPGR